MTSRPVRPRLAPLPREAWSEEVRTMIERTPGGATEPLNIFTTLVRHPTLVRRELPPRDRELLILRTAWNCRSEYEWGQHVRIGLAAGLAQEEIDRVPAGPAAPGWSPFDAALLRAADELHADACVSDATWAVLAGRYAEAQLIEVPMLVGQYHMVGFTLNSLGVQREPGVPGLPLRGS